MVGDTKQHPLNVVSIQKFTKIYYPNTRVTFQTIKSLPMTAEPCELIPMVGAICSIIGVLLQVIPAPESWTAEKLRNIIDNEMTKHNICDFTISEIIGFQPFATGKNSLCAVIGKDKQSDCTYKLYVFKDKDVTILKLEQFCVEDPQTVRCALRDFRKKGISFTDHLISHANEKRGCKYTVTLDAVASGITEMVLLR